MRLDNFIHTPKYN